MKKTIIILLFAAIAFTSLQSACSKSEAQTTPAATTATQQNKIIYMKITGPAYSRIQEIWVSNYDGSGASKINVSLPAGIYFAYSAPIISPDRQKLFFNAGELDSYGDADDDLYSCNIDGSGVRKVADNNGGSIQIGQAY